LRGLAEDVCNDKTVKNDSISEGKDMKKMPAVGGLGVYTPRCRGEVKRGGDPQALKNPDWAHERKRIGGLEG